MEDHIPTDPPVGFPTHLLPMFFLITGIFRNNVAFLVLFNGRLEWLLLDERLIDYVRELQLQNPIDQINWQRLCDYFLTIFTNLPFDLNQGITEIEWIDWDNVIFLRRTLLISLKDGREVLAKYIENFGEMDCEKSGRREHHIKCQIRGTDEEDIIPISAILQHMISKKDKNEYDEKLAQQKANEKAARDAEEARKYSEDYKAQMSERGEIVSFPGMQRYYPLFTPEFMIILFLLCKRFEIKIGFGYRFNLIVDRLRYFVGNSDFLPQLEEDKDAFEAFVEKYMTQIVGRVIRSRTIRFQLFIAPKESRIPEYLHRVFEYHCHLTKNYSPTQADVNAFLRKGDEYFTSLAQEMAERSESPLELSDEYWTNWKEFGILTMLTKSCYPMCEVIFPMVPTPNIFPSDLF